MIGEKMTKQIIFADGNDFLGGMDWLLNLPPGKMACVQMLVRVLLSGGILTHGWTMALLQ